MAYSPNATFDPGGSARAGQSLASPLQEALNKYEETKRKTAFADTAFDYLKNVPGAISPEALSRYHNMSGTQKYEAVVAAASNATQIAAQQEREQKLLEKAQEGIAQPLVTSDGTQVPGQFYVPGARRVVESQPAVPSGQAPGSAVYDETGKQIGIWDAHGKITKLTAPSRAAQDSWQKLNGDVKATTGFDVADWNRADVKQIADGNFVATLGGSKHPKTGKLQGGKVLKVPARQYQEFLGRYKALEGTDGSAAVEIPATEPAAAGSGVAPEMPPAGQSPPQQEQAQAIKAKFRAGEITREDALKQLQALGFQ